MERLRRFPGEDEEVAMMIRLPQRPWSQGDGVEQ
jgi:hypothetical protein